MFKFSYEKNGCPFCSNHHGEPYHEIDFPHGKVNWVRCPADRVIYQNPRLDDHSISFLFDSKDYISAGQSETPLGYYSYFDGEKARLAMGELKIREIEKKLTSTPLNILEIGCATGSFLKVCQDRGHKVIGIDASSVFADYGRKNYALDIHVGLFEKMSFPESSFDVVAIFGSLSCLSTPRKVFSSIRSILKPGGLVVFNTPVLDGWVARLYGRHLWIFRPSGQVLYTRSNVAHLLEMEGFCLVEAKRDRQAVSIEKLALVSGLSFLGKIFGSLRSLYITCPVPSVYQFTGTKIA